MSIYFLNEIKYWATPLNINHICRMCRVLKSLTKVKARSQCFFPCSFSVWLLPKPPSLNNLFYFLHSAALPTGCCVCVCALYIYNSFGFYHYTNILNSSRSTWKKKSRVRLWEPNVKQSLHKMVGIWTCFRCGFILWIFRATQIRVCLYTELYSRNKIKDVDKGMCHHWKLWKSEFTLFKHCTNSIKVKGPTKVFSSFPAITHSENSNWR